MNSFHAGHWMKRSGYRSFEPGKIDRPWKIDDAIVQESLSTADRHLGRLDMFSEYVPNLDLVFTHLFTHPWVNAAQVSEVCTVSPGTAYTLIERFVTCGLLREITGAKRGKLYLFDPYLKLFH